MKTGAASAKMASEVWQIAGRKRGRLRQVFFVRLQVDRVVEVVACFHSFLVYHLPGFEGECVEHGGNGIVNQSKSSLCHLGDLDRWSDGFHLTRTVADYAVPGLPIPCAAYIVVGILGQHRELQKVSWALLARNCDVGIKEVARVLLKRNKLDLLGRMRGWLPKKSSVDV